MDAAPHGLEVRCVAPGSTGTRNLAAALDDLADGREICTVDRTFSCRSVSQCVNALIVYPYERPQGLVVNEDDAVEIPEMFAGYVEEENPEIDPDYGAGASGGRFAVGIQRLPVGR